jgi:hypothetical protein
MQNKSTNKDVQASGQENPETSLKRKNDTVAERVPSKAGRKYADYTG